MNAEGKAAFPQGVRKESPCPVRGGAGGDPEDSSRRECAGVDLAPGVTERWRANYHL